MLDKDSLRQIARVADEAGLQRAALLAIAEVESGGRAFVTVNGRKEPLIRFEGHYFDRRLSGDRRAQGRAAGLADPKAGAVKNPASQAERWVMLERAKAIDRQAAYESVSWGLGQVMGAHWAWLGFASVDALVDSARSGAAGQAELMLRYIDKAGLSGAVRDRDWAAFARGYNGPDYKRHGYDTKLAKAYAQHAASTQNAAPSTNPAPVGATMLRLGSRGDAVAELQTLLTATGYPAIADGVFGAATEQAVRQFQNDRALVVDGVAGAATLTALRDVMTSFDNAPGMLSRLLDRLWRWWRGG